MCVCVCVCVCAVCVCVCVFGVSTFFLFWCQHISFFLSFKILLFSKDELKVTVKTFVIYLNFK